MSRVVDLSKLLSSDQLTQTTLADATGVILDVDSLQVFTLNESAVVIVEALRAGAETRRELVDRLLEVFEVDEETAARDVDEFVTELSRHLIEKRKKSHG